MALPPGETNGQIIKQNKTTSSDVHLTYFISGKYCLFGGLLNHIFLAKTLKLALGSLALLIVFL